MMEEDNEIIPLGILFGSLAYNDLDEYEAFLERLNGKSSIDTLLTIHSALRYAQSKGIFSLEESEVISILLRKIKT